ncbi:MAG: hypothetical protein WCK09_06755 [Bacteroidota bacterium]
MEEKDPIANKFKSAFSDYRGEPPSDVWEHVRRELHPEPKPESLWNRITTFSFFKEMKPGFYFALGGGVVMLFLAIVYLGSSDRYTIHGHAYAGELRLCRGTAVLFRVADKSMPWDSASHYRTAMIDVNGHYQFPKVESGKYLLRIAPDENSEAAKTFRPSWFDQHENPDSCHLIIVENDDENADVHLMSKSKIPK